MEKKRFLVLLALIIVWHLGCACNITKNCSNVEKIKITFFAEDTTKNREPGLSRFGPFFTYETNSFEVLSEVTKYYKWKKAPYLRVITNTKVDLFYDTNLIQLEAAISGKHPEISFIRYHKGNRAITRYIPEKTRNFLVELYNKVPAKEGWVRF